MPFRILRDTAAFNSYVLDSILPFSEKIDNGDKILMQGMGISVLPVPEPRVNLDCELVQGEVAVGVRPTLPVEGVDMILAGSCAALGESPPPVVILRRA